MSWSTCELDVIYEPNFSILFSMRGIKYHEVSPKKILNPCAEENFHTFFKFKKLVLWGLKIVKSSLSPSSLSKQIFSVSWIEISLVISLFRSIFKSFPFWQLLLVNAVADVWLVWLLLLLFSIPELLFVIGRLGGKASRIILLHHLLFSFFAATFIAFILVSRFKISIFSLSRSVQ